MKALFRVVAVVAFVGIVAGCACVNITPEERVEIANLHENGITWSGERDNGGFEPPANMIVATAWAFLPGAGQRFVANKMVAYGCSEADMCLRGGQQLWSTGSLMIGLSWCPFVYIFTYPFGLIGVITDVNRVNNLALLQWVNEQNKE